MAKVEVNQFDQTNDNNLDVNAISIAEGCAPANINNAIRAVMGALARMANGVAGIVSLAVSGNTTVGGTLGVSGNTTVGGTLGVTGNTTVGGTLGVTGALTAAYIHSTGYGQIDGNLTVAGPNVGVGSSTLLYDSGGVANIRGGNGGTYGYFVFHFNGNGYAQNGSWISVSDASTKTDVVSVSDARSKILSMRGVFYTEIATGKRKVGVIGDELDAVMPEATEHFTHEGTGADMIGVNYGGLAGVFIESYRDLSDLVDAQAAQIAALQALLAKHNLT